MQTAEVYELTCVCGKTIALPAFGEHRCPKCGAVLTIQFKLKEVSNGTSPQPDQAGDCNVPTR